MTEIVCSGLPASAIKIPKVLVAACFARTRIIKPTIVNKSCLPIFPSKTLNAGDIKKSIMIIREVKKSNR